MSRTSTAVLAYGVVLTPEELNLAPWGDDWDWDIRKWAASIDLARTCDTPYCHLFAWDSDATGAVIGSSAWPCRASRSWNRPPTALQLNFNISPDPVFQNFVAEYLPHVRYVPDWFLFSELS